MLSLSRKPLDGSQKTQQLLRQVIVTNTLVRDGKKQAIPSKEIVPGDLVLLSAEDLITAARRSSACLLADLATLGGKSRIQAAAFGVLRNIGGYCYYLSCRGRDCQTALL